MKQGYREALDWLRSCERDQLAASEDPGCSYVASQVGLISELLKDCAVDPIPLSERKPGLEDCHCIANSTARDGAYIWAGSIIQAVGLNSFWNWDLVGRDYMITHSASGRGATLYTHRLPASTKYLPARVVG